MSARSDPSANFRRITANYGGSVAGGQLPQHDRDADRPLAEGAPPLPRARVRKARHLAAGPRSRRDRAEKPFNNLLRNLSWQDHEGKDITSEIAPRDLSISLCVTFLGRTTRGRTSHGQVPRSSKLMFANYTSRARS